MDQGGTIDARNFSNALEFNKKKNQAFLASFGSNNDQLPNKEIYTVDHMQPNDYKKRIVVILNIPDF